MSLKQVFLNYLKTYGYMSIDDMERICKQEHRKIDNGSRRLRELMVSDPITTKTNSRGAIIGYIWQESAPRAEISENVAKILASWQKPPIKETNKLF